MKAHQRLTGIALFVLLFITCKKDSTNTTSNPTLPPDTTQLYVATCYVTHFTEYHVHYKQDEYQLTYGFGNRFLFIENVNAILGTTSNRKPVSITYTDTTVVVVRLPVYSGRKNTYDSFVLNRAGQVLYHFFLDSGFSHTEYTYTYDDRQQLATMEEYNTSGRDQIHYYRWQDGDLVQDSVGGSLHPQNFTYYTSRLASPASPDRLQDVISYGVVRFKSKHLLKSGGQLQIRGFNYNILDNKYSFFGSGNVATDTVILPHDTLIRSFNYFCN